MKKIIGLISFICFLTNVALAQEKLYLKNQREPIECTVVEINSEEVKYRPADADQLTIGVNKMEVNKIIFKSGRVQYFTDPLEDFNFYKGQKRWVAKLGLLSPAFGFTDLYLEKSVKPGRSFEFQASIIGLGKNKTYYSNYNPNYQENYLDQRGGSVGAGLKLLRMPDFELRNRKLMHILQGSYLKPAINLGYYQRNFFIQDYTTGNLSTIKKGIVTSQLSISVGKQWILDNTISIEIYGLMGLGIDNYRSQQSQIKKDYGNAVPYFDDEVLPYSNFGYTKFGRGDAGVTIGGGLKLGYLFNWKKPKDTIKTKK